MIVDSTGYGRTSAPVKLKEKFWRMILKYLCYGVRTNMILLCIPSHRGIQQQDKNVLNELKYYGKAVHIVLTKVDKVRNNEDLMQTIFQT